MLKKLSQYTLALIGLTFLFSSCKKDYESITSVDATAIKAYIAKNNLTVIEDSLKTGYYYQILNVGNDTAKYFTNADSVLYSAEIKGLENGTSYLSTSSTANLGTLVGYTNVVGTSTTITSSISVPAIRDVMQKLKPGGSARILLPSNLGYGKNGLGPIGSNENLDIYITAFPEVQQWKLDDRLIKEFITTKGLTMIKDPSRVYYSISEVGDGTYAIDGNSTITVAYTLRLTDGTVIDSSTSAAIALGGKDGASPASLAWTKVIPGKLEKGGKMRMLIPSDQAYGTVGTTGVPGNAILDFDIEILSVVN